MGQKRCVIQSGSDTVSWPLNRIRIQIKGVFTLGFQCESDPDQIQIGAFMQTAHPAKLPLGGFEPVLSLEPIPQVWYM